MHWATVNGGNGNWKRNSETGNGRQFYKATNEIISRQIDLVYSIHVL